MDNIISHTLFQAYSILKTNEMEYTEKWLSLVTKAIEKDGYEKAKAKMRIIKLKIATGLIEI